MLSSLFLTLNLAFGFAATSNIDGVNLEREKTILKVALATAKKDSTRIFRGFRSQEFNAPLEMVKNSIINFDEKCNNDLKNKRQFTDKNKKCKYINRNLIESVIVKNTQYQGPKEQNEKERFIVTRYIYNRGSFTQNDLMVTYDYINEQKERVYEIKQYMLNDEESKKYLASPVKRDSAFKEANGHFVLIEKAKDKTIFNYEYIGKTDHWFLNKDMMVGQVYDTVATGIDDLFKSVEVESSAQKMAN